MHSYRDSNVRLYLQCTVSLTLEADCERLLQLLPLHLSTTIMQLLVARSKKIKLKAAVIILVIMMLPRLWLLTKGFPAESTQQGSLCEEHGNCALFVPDRIFSATTNEDATVVDNSHLQHALIVPKTTPNFFAYPARLKLLLERGTMLTTASGCRIANWVYPFPKLSNAHFDECPRFRGNHNLLLNVSTLQNMDTVYVPLKRKLEHFILHTLPQISVPIVVISGGMHLAKTVKQSLIDKLLANDYVIHWFCVNLDPYGGTDPYHYKVRVAIVHESLLLLAVASTLHTRRIPYSRQT
jgi:hypothetical protein